MLRNALALCIVLSASGYSQSPAMDQFLGDWHPLGSPDDLKRVVIERKGAGFTVQIWSECLPTDCYWGEAAAATSHGTSLSAKFDRSHEELTEEFALLGDGSLQVTSRKTGSIENTHAAYLTKGESEGVSLRLPIFTPPAEVTKPGELPAAGLSDAIDQTSLHCSFLVEPAAIALDTAGGDSKFAVHAPLGCPWTSESDSAWLTVTTGLSGATDGQVVLSASENTGSPRTGTVVIGGVPVTITQKGADRTWEIPMLFFGSGFWSIVRITNPSTSSRPVRMDLYQQSGDRVRTKPVFDLQPQETLEVVIEPRQVQLYRRNPQRPGDLNGPRILEVVLGGAMPSQGSAWIRIMQSHEDRVPDLEVTAFVEVLKDNKISDFRRSTVEPHQVRALTIRASEVRGQDIYFLNVSDRSTMVTFCVGNKVERDPCVKKDSLADRSLVKPNQFVVLTVKKFTERYFFVESSQPGSAILAKLIPTNGITKVFTSESSINFGEPSR